MDTLWLQVTGTLCNIACKHCFISCGPKVDRHKMLTREACVAAMDDAVARGCREIWFTGGEPFLHPEILDVLDAALARAPVGILTNGMLIDEDLATALGERFRDAPYNLEVRVSLDGATAEANDRIRGKGVFEATREGIRRLAAAGVELIVAISVLDDNAPEREEFVGLLRELGVPRPRVKWIPVFRMGREAGRQRAYEPWEVLAAEDLAAEDAAVRLMCGTGRTVTSEGVFPCPILINEPAYKLGSALGEAMGAAPVDHPACATCWQESFSCST
ncbi:MAG: radical SAM protein [Deltaproteobacteria bacterium]|nr:MAG: radical SAM protein [Deltaproteobacteria bacterium]